MASLRMMVPEATTNYVKNPSIRYETTGWNAVGSAISRVFDVARFGVSCLMVDTNGSAINEGTYYRVNDLVGISEPVTVSAYVRGTGFVRIRVISTPGGREFSSDRIQLSSDRWQRIEVTGYTVGTNDTRLYVETHGDASQNTVFYVDGAQMERKAYSTSYCDGDQPGCRWNTVSHSSQSSRSAYTRDGGRWIIVAGPEREEENLYMTLAGGLGMAPIRNNIQSFAIQPGSFYQNTKIGDRLITLTFHAKHEDTELFTGCDPATRRNLHRLRNMIIDVVKPDRSRAGQEFWIEYQDGDYPIYLKVRYDGGLEGDWDIRNQWINSFPLRLLAVSPMAQEDSQEVQQIDFQESAILNDVAGRIDGVWSHLNYGVSDDVLDLALTSRQQVIAVGSFLNANNSASAIDPLISANRIALWDGSQWNYVGTGANGIIRHAAIAPNGYIYVTGEFTTIGGVAASRIAYYNTDTATWTAMSTGLNSTGRAIVVAPSGHVFVGGDFTTAGGVTANRIARWNGSGWIAVGANSGLNGAVYTLDISLDGLILYVGGAFTDENGNPGSGLTRVANFNIPAGTWSAMSSGFNGTVLDVVVSPSGTVYAGGEFTASGAQTISYVAQWNGAIWIPMGIGMNGAVYSISVSQGSDIVAAGLFTQAGGVDAHRVALWNGSNWVHLDIQLGVGVTGSQALAVLFTRNGDLYIGGNSLSNGTNPSLFSGITTVENKGNAQVSPFVFIRGPATLRWIENQTSGHRCFFDLDILLGEEITIDFSAAAVRSTLRGNLFHASLEGSNFHQFKLLPGDNKVAALMINDVGATMYMSHIPHHWGADSTQQGESL